MSPVDRQLRVLAGDRLVIVNARVSQWWLASCSSLAEVRKGAEAAAARAPQLIHHHPHGTR